MISNTMNDNEKLSNITDEYRLIQSCYLDKFLKEYDEIRQKNGIDEKSEFPYCFEFQTESPKNWLCIVSKDPSHKTYKCIESCTSFFLNYEILRDSWFHQFHWNAIKVYKLDGGGQIQRFDDCFFESYKNEMKLTFVNKIDVVKHFFVNNINNLVYRHVLWFSDDIIGLVKDGYILGCVNFKNSCCLFKHFVYKRRPSQIKKIMGISSLSLLHRAIKTDLNNIEFDKDTYFYVEDLFRCMKRLHTIQKKHEEDMYKRWTNQ